MDEIKLQKETNPEVLRKCVLIKNLSEFTEQDDVIQCFNDFGTVENLTFVSIEDIKYMKTCIIMMSSAEEASRILAIPIHKIDLIDSRVEEYHGISSLQSIKKGKFKLLVTGLPIKSDEKVCRHVEGLFQHYDLTGVEPLKQEGVFTGLAVIYFMTDEERIKAQKFCRSKDFYKAFKYPEELEQIPKEKKRREVIV